MEAIPHDKINQHYVCKYVNILILKEFYPKTRNMSNYMYLKSKLCWTFNWRLLWKFLLNWTFLCLQRPEIQNQDRNGNRAKEEIVDTPYEEEKEVM